MIKRIHFKAVFGFLLMFLVLAPFSAFAEKRVVKVVVENAGIRLKPDMESEILEYPQIGRIFEVDEKIQGWYKIRFSSQVGIPITGYIHEMYVEETIEEVKPPEKKEPESKREPERKPAPPAAAGKTEKVPGVELILSGGYNTGFSADETISYSETVAYQLLTRGESGGTISSSLKKPLGFGGALNVFITPGFGFQLRADLNSKADITPESISTYALKTLWKDGSTNSYANEWEVTGNASVMAISANIVIRAATNAMFAPFFSGGASYFTGKTIVNTTIAEFDTWLDYYQYYAAFVIPIKVDAAVSGIGFNAGGGAHILFSPNFGISIEARYFMKSAVEQSWSIRPGTYRSFLGNLQVTLDQGGADTIAQKIPPYKLNPSFLKASLGLVLRF